MRREPIDRHFQSAHTEVFFGVIDINRIDERRADKLFLGQSVFRAEPLVLLVAVAVVLDRAL